MRTPRRLLVAAGLVSASMAGCPILLSDTFQFGPDATAPSAALDGSEAAAIAEASAGEQNTSEEDHADAAVERDGATASDANTAHDATEATVESDGSSTTEASTCCNVSRSDPLDQSTFDVWIPRGTARGLPAYTELTADMPNQSGAVFWPQTETWSDFDVSFDFSITKVGTGFPPPADGLAFVAVADVVTECEGGSRMCVFGATNGVALLFRTYVTSQEPSKPYVALVDTSRSLGSSAGPLFFEGGVTFVNGGVNGGVVTLVPDPDAAPPAASWQTACLRVLGGKATVHLGAQTLLSDVPLSGPASIHWGFVGSTGAASERNAVRNVRWSFATGCGTTARCSDAGLCGSFP